MMQAERKIVYSFTAIVVASVIVLSLFAYTINANQKALREGQRAHDALCALRADLRFRVDSAKEFVRLHPNGAFGLSAKAIQANIINQEATLVTLEDLGC